MYQNYRETHGCTTSNNVSIYEKALADFEPQKPASQQRKLDGVNTQVAMRRSSMGEVGHSSNGRLKGLRGMHSRMTNSVLLNKQQKSMIQEESLASGMGHGQRRYPNELARILNEDY